MGAIRDADLRPLLRQIKAPTLVINGSADPATPPQLGNAIAAGVPRAQVVTLPAAHISNIEAKAAFDERGFKSDRAERSCTRCTSRGSM